MVKAAEAATVMLKTFVTACWGLPESVNMTVKLKTPVAVGVPEMTPVLLLSVRPVGSEPVATTHV